MVDPPPPQDIARRSFDVVRRGYEQQEVRGFLHEVSALVERLQRTEAELRERAERAEARLGVAEKPDESMLLEVLGAETTRVLTSAHEAAAEIRTKAEASVERIVAEATAEAARLRSTASLESDALLSAAKSEGEAILAEARGELGRRTEEAQVAVAHLREEGEAQAQALRDEGQAVLERARAEAEALVDAAREQGRQMVAEAQAVREKVLRDLVVRRKRARQQVEKLNAGRERLLQAYDVVRRTIDEATTELHVSLTDARLAANAAARRVEDEPDSSLEEIDAEVSAAGLLDLTVVDLDDRDADLDEHDDDDSPGPLSGEVPAVDPTPDRPAAPAASESQAAQAAQATQSQDAPLEAAHNPESAVEVTPTPSGAVAGLDSVAALDDRRSRKAKRRKGFEGLPAGELDVVAPPSPLEGVRIIPAPIEPAAADAAETSDHVEVDAPSLSEVELVSEAVEPPIPHLPVDALGVGNELADAAVGTPDVAPAIDEAHSVSSEVEPDVAADEPAAELDEIVDDASSAVGISDEAAEEVLEVVEVVHDEPAADEEHSADEDQPADDEAVTPHIATEAAASSADEVFARLRADELAPGEDASGDPTADRTAEDPGDTASAEVGSIVDEVTPPDGTGAARPDVSPDGPFAARAQAVGPLEKELKRALKRALADEQNEVLDLLRRSKPKSVDDVLPDPDQHAVRWAEAATEALTAAAAAGASSRDGSPPSTSVANLATELAESLTVPLRERIDRGFAASDGNLDDIADRVRALYREWRGQRLNDAAGHYASAAYARGVFDAIDDGAKVSWVIDPSAGACPDCDDNVLGGTVVKGEEFPTGNLTAPAHPGCHCLVLASPT